MAPDGYERGAPEAHSVKLAEHEVRISAVESALAHLGKRQDEILRELSRMREEAHTDRAQSNVSLKKIQLIILAFIVLYMLDPPGAEGALQALIKLIG